MEIDIQNVPKIKIEHSYEIYQIMRKVFFERHKEVDILKEHFWTIALNMGNKILAIELVSMGSNTRTVVSSQEVYRIPLYKNANKVICVHNHPSETLKPSDADKELTNKLIQAGLLFDIDLIDHLIITTHSYFSFADSGLIEELRWSPKYALTFIRDKQVKKEVEKIKKQLKQQQKDSNLEGIRKGEIKGLEKGRKEEKRHIAKQMLADGKPIAEIKKYTGLSNQWIGRLKNELARVST